MREVVRDTAQYTCYRQTVMYGGTNCYLLLDKESGQAAVIDPGGDAEMIIGALNELAAQPVLIINTHGHWDHIGANKALQTHYDIPIAIHQDDAVYLSDGAYSAAAMFHGDGDGGKAGYLLGDGDTLEVGALQLQVLHTPGHTRGGVCLLLEGLLFSGDTLFQLSIGRSDLRGGDYDALRQSLARLGALDDDLLVLPGHGPTSQLGYEKLHNPYLRD